MIINNPTIIIKGKEVLGGEYNIEQIVDGDNCELVVTTASGASKPKLQEKTANPTTTTQTVTPDENYDGLSSVEILAVDNSIDENIKAENIKKNITILGVTGTLESGGGSGTSKLPQVVDGSVTELTAEDLAGATRIRDRMFYYSTMLTSIEIPESITSIGNSAFYYCISLTSITIPDSVTSIGEQAFRQCGLTSVTIPSSITIINVEAFQYCSNLTSVTIPNSITQIKSSAFYGCDSLTTMTILATTPPTLAYANAISSATTTIYIPAGTLSAYQSATNWSSFADKFVEMEA